MKAPLLVILIAGFCLAFKPDERIESIVKSYTIGKLGQIESFELFRIDSLTPKLMLSLHQSRITDSLTILQPVLDALNNQYETCLAGYKKYPKDKFFKDSYTKATNELSALKGWLSEMIRRSNDLDSTIAKADSTTFIGYLTQAAVKRYENGNRVFTIYDTATVVLDREYKVIDKLQW